MNLSMEQNHRHREQTGGEGLGEGWSGRLELVDVSFNIY